MRYYQLSYAGITSMATSYSHKGQPFTTIGAKKLNFCVRHGNRCILLAIATTLMRTLRSQNWLSLFNCCLEPNVLVIETCSQSQKPAPACTLTWLSPRPISTGPLHASLHFHFQPIYLIISQGSYFHIGMGNLISRGASHLDAFSVYPFRS